MQKDKVRVYVLARELNVDTKDLLDLCKQAGLDVKNQLSSLDPDQRDMVEDMVKRGGKPAPASTSPKPTATAVLPDVNKTIRNLDSRARKEPEAAPVHKTEVVEESPEPPTPEPAPPEEKEAETPATAAAATEEDAAPPPEPEVAAAAEIPPSAPPTPAPTPTTPAAAQSEAKPPESESEPPAKAPEPKPAPPKPTAPLPEVSKPGMRDLSSSRPSGPRTPRKRDARPTPSVSTPQGASTPSLNDRGKTVKKDEAPTQTPKKRLTPDMLKEAQQGNVIRPEHVLKPQTEQPAPNTGEFEEEDGDKKGAAGSKKKGVVGRDARRQQRNERAKKRRDREPETQVQVQGGRVVTLDDDRPRNRQRLRQRRAKGPSVQPRKERVAIEPPISVRAFSEATGIPSVQILFKLREHMDVMPNINTTLDNEIAELLAMDFELDVEIRQPVTAEDDLIAKFAVEDKPEDLQPRAPVVTVMGHVDHGKTSLLDKIRASNVVDSEAGGITQGNRAWRVEHGGRPITFLDTPGHEAFTKMRARGAQVTDIAVIVVAADDGVMPQTEEAINHAVAAEVSLVVAINKVDLPNANLDKTRQKLYGMSVLPDDMGGDTPFVETSAATGMGIDELLEQISVVAELKELKANPNKPANGTCLEAMLSEGEGVRATLLVKDGTLRKGDVILCGASFGRVRQMYDDLGRPIEEAGPSVPVRITGLDDVPDADDPFMVVNDLTTARQIAEDRRSKRVAATQFQRPAFTLESLTESQVAEVKVILKADFRGTIEAVRKEIDKLQHDEVRVRILEAATGGITENDVWLALTSPEDTIIIGFNVVPDDRARALAEEKGIQIRQYDVIYNLANDIKAALEGKLKPIEEVVHLGRAVIRQTFKISRVGTIAGCYVTQGVIPRNAKVRLIRAGVVVYPPPERTAQIDTLKRHKDDASEVREGFECGIKIAGYDDVKVDDVIEAYRIEQVQRTLD